MRWFNFEKPMQEVASSEKKGLAVYIRSVRTSAILSEVFCGVQLRSVQPILRASQVQMMVEQFDLDGTGKLEFEGRLDRGKCPSDSCATQSAT